MEQATRVRVLPLQKRGKSSVTRLLDSTGSLIDELGFEQLTTQLVAKRSEVSIGLVYHYFPDRLALVEALVTRNLDRFVAAVEDMLGQPSTLTWSDALDGTINVLVQLYRDEPGFAKVGFTDRFLASQDAPARLAAHDPAPQLAGLFQRRFGREWPGGPDMLMRLEVALEIADAVVSRSFRSDAGGEDQITGELAETLAAYLAPALDRG